MSDLRFSTDSAIDQKFDAFLIKSRISAGDLRRQRVTDTKELIMKQLTTSSDLIANIPQLDTDDDVVFQEVKDFAQKRGATVIFILPSRHAFDRDDVPSHCAGTWKYDFSGNGKYTKR